MRKLIYIAFLLPLLSFGQWDAMLLASQQQAVSYGTPVDTNIKISDSDDDAEENKGDDSVVFTSSDLEIRYDGHDQIIGMRFDGLDIPVGAKINSAYIQFTADPVLGTSGAVDVTIKGEKGAAPAAFTTTSGDISDRPLTTASVTWSPANWATGDARTSNEQTDDFKNVVQEIIDDGSYSSTDAIVIIMDGASDTDYRRAESANGVGGEAPEIFINYSPLASSYLPSPAAGNPNPEIIVNDPASFESEDNSLESWHAAYANVSISVESDETNGYGQYVARATADVAGTLRRTHIEPDASNFTSGQVYTVYILERSSDTNDDARYRNSDGYSDADGNNQHSAHTSWVLHTFDFTSDGTTPDFEIFVRNTSSLDDWVEYKLSVKEKDD